ncbi:ribosomal protein S18-alanine N-acetyltransferase [Komagataeibacter sp. AV436]|uniref:[Ribosomal protein bS18]-alanine N-acetyltransferase n=1 Tax=Komagataeibacter melomenusus TaxID=2766578 RepID=A0ABX2AFS7_9PROT|nr:ribosomal protein S18-alanine N-acetyltransferase [Komagataeibacter melomenusus]MBV1831105.1 ribosomal protein S18-alanine N-acetyltransferase [Komagataeibacter melomenusus]NPC66654.1 ribosomal protein S18-alanine N-acetyltransferase [Komagataeibacter melomenusus]
MTDNAALAGQAGLLARIHAAAFPPVHRWDAQAMAALLAMPGVFVLFAQGEGVPPDAGFIMARTLLDEAEILTFAVDPAWQGQGIGRALLARCVNEAARAGAASLFLEVADDNVAALGLYHAAGFAVVGVRRRYYPDGADACVMKRAI